MSPIFFMPTVELSAEPNFLPLNSSEIMLLLIGAALTLIASLFLEVIRYFTNGLGKFSIYRKFVYNNEKPAGLIESNTHGTALQVPIWIEFINTKNKPFVVRNLSLQLYDRKRPVAELMQINYGKDIVYGATGWYTFLIPPRSSQTYKLLYMIYQREIGDHNFQSLVLEYHNGKGQAKKLKLADCPEGINSMPKIPTGRWEKLLPL